MPSIMKSASHKRMKGLRVGLHMKEKVNIFGSSFFIHGDIISRLIFDVCAAVSCVLAAVDRGGVETRWAFVVE